MSFCFTAPSLGALHVRVLCGSKCTVAISMLRSISLFCLEMRRYFNTLLILVIYIFVISKNIAFFLLYKITLMVIRCEVPRTIMDMK